MTAQDLKIWLAVGWVRDLTAGEFAKHLRMIKNLGVDSGKH